MLHNDDPATKMELYPHKMEIVYGIAKGMRYLHDELKPSLLHRDLKPGNVLITAKWRAKLTDFGTIAEAVNRSSVGNATKKSKKLSKQVVTGPDAKCGITGTLLYMGPEYILRGANLSVEEGRAADVWSFGVTVWEIVTEELPDLLSLRSTQCGRGPESGAYAKLYQQRLGLPPREQVPCWVPNAASSNHMPSVAPMPSWAEMLIGSCLKFNWRKRPSFEAIVSHFDANHQERLSSLTVASSILSPHAMRRQSGSVRRRGSRGQHFTDSGAHSVTELCAVVGDKEVADDGLYLETSFPDGVADLKQPLLRFHK